MSKTHVSMKYIRNLWGKTFRCGYCELYYIFYNEDPVYYNSGIYGWNCDIYCDYKRDIAITTGYRNMIGKNIPSELLKKYTDKAKAIIENQWKFSFDEIKNALNENREKFLDELNNI